MSNIDIEYKLVEQIKDELDFPPSTTGIIVEYLNRHGWIRTPDEAEAAARGEAHRRRIELTESQVEAIGRDAINYFTPGGTWADWARAVFKSADFPVVPDPEPTIPVPTEPGARFIAHSPKWCDDAEDQREFIVAGSILVDLSNGALFRADVFGEDWTVTALVKAPGDGGDDER